jgi:hypothetical protein
LVFLDYGGYFIGNIGDRVGYEFVEVSVGMETSVCFDKFIGIHIGMVVYC